MLFLLALFFHSSAGAASFDKAGFHITVEPIVGYEMSKVNTPTVHTRGMFIYGGRVTAGHKLISGEGEYTQGSSNETFITQDQNIKTDKQNARLGIRSAIGATHWLDFLLRAGGQATKTRTASTTISTATTLTSTPDWEIRPYAGTGLQLNLFSAVSFAFEATYLFKSVKDWSQNDIQTSVSFKFNLPTK